jgi:hypothetical protein
MECQGNPLATAYTVDVADARPSQDEIALIIAFRKQHKESQERFWSRIGVPQSSGSRYETRQLRIPEPVLLLVRLRLSGQVSTVDLYAAHQPLCEEPITDESGLPQRRAAPACSDYFVQRQEERALGAQGTLTRVDRSA